MALADVTVPDCSFHWDIHHPFIPFRLLSASFYHGSSIFTQWKVAIYPLERKINYLRFRFHLEIEKNFDGGREIRANRVKVGIFLHNRCIDEKDVANVSFNQTNFFAYSFGANAIENALQDQELLIVKITLDLPAKALDDRYTNDLQFLSDDLLQLLNKQRHSDMQLCSSEGDILPVHSCILDARWGNFLRNNPLNNMEVNVNISVQVLRDILIYLYSGIVRFGLPNNKDENYVPELFHVLDNYELRHLKRFVHKRDMKQRRISERNAITITLTFPLKELVSSQIVGGQRELFVHKTPYGLTFRIYVQTYSNCGPWLSYSLKSNSEITLYAQVSLDIRKRILETRGTVGPDYHQITHVHQHDYTIHPNELEPSENALFLGCPETFRNLDLVNNTAQIGEDWGSILFTLKFTEGIFSYQIQSLVDDLDAEEDEMERLTLLGDHLFELFLNPTEADLRIKAPTENENQPNEIYPIHGAIFAARVPFWKQVFTVFQERDDMPSEATLLLRSEALPFVLRYIYSSRTDYVSPDLFNDIQRFAFTGGFISLHSRIISIRNNPDIHDSDSE